MVTKKKSFGTHQKDYVFMVACKDIVDQAIIDVLCSAGPAGILPRDMVKALAKYKLTPWNVTQRIRRMNKRSDRHIAKEVAEKRGLKWGTNKLDLCELGRNQRRDKPRK